MHQCLTIKLVLYDIIEDFQQEKDQVVVGSIREQEPGSGESLQQFNNVILLITSTAVFQTRGRARVKALDLAYHQRTAYKNILRLLKTPD